MDPKAPKPPGFLKKLWNKTTPKKKPENQIKTSIPAGNHNLSF